MMLKELGIIVFIAVFLGLVTWLFHPKAPIYGKTDIGADEILLNSALQIIDSVLWVDARSKLNFDEDHIPGAVLLNEDDWETLLTEFMEKWDPDITIIVYCDSRLCKASKKVAQRLKSELQISNIHTLHGGWESWQSYQEHRY